MRLSIMVFVLLLSGSTPWAAVNSKLGVSNHIGACGPADPLGAYEHWHQRPMDYIVDTIPNDTWQHFTRWGVDFIVQKYRDVPNPQRLKLSLAMLPKDAAATGASLARGAGGEYDAIFAGLARKLVAGGLGRVTLRLGWELNGHWMRWNPANAQEEVQYRDFWRQVHRAMMSVPGAAFQWDWNVTAAADRARSYLGAYPGNAYVDFISVDIYDTYSGPHGYPRQPDDTPQKTWRRQQLAWNYRLARANHGMEFYYAFAKQMNKPFAIPEWGIWRGYAGNNPGGDDNPWFIKQMHDWVRAHDVHHLVYFDYCDANVNHSLLSSEHALSAQAYERQFIDRKNIIRAVRSPSAITNTGSYQVVVDYHALEAADILLTLEGKAADGGGWHGSARKTVAAGTGTATLDLAIPPGHQPELNAVKTWKIRLMPKGGLWSDAHAEVHRDVAIRPALADGLGGVVAPDYIFSSGTYYVRVDYTAQQTRDLLVSLEGDGWFGSGRTTVSAGAGSAVVAVKIAAGREPPRGSVQVWKTRLVEHTRDWRTAFEERHSPVSVF